MNGKFWGNVALCVGILGMGIFVVDVIKATSDPQTLLAPPVKREAASSELFETLSLAGASITAQGNGRLVKGTFTIVNGSAHDVRQVDIVCSHADNAGQGMGRDTWVVAETIKAGASVTSTPPGKKYLSTRVATSVCEIVDAQEVTEPFLAVHRVSPGQGGHGGHQQTSGHH